MVNQSGRPCDTVRSEKIGMVYDYMLERADPKTGRIAVSAPMLAKHISTEPRTARVYVAALVHSGKLVQISETKRGTTTLYRIPALCSGDVLTHVEKDLCIANNRPQRTEISFRGVPEIQPGIEAQFKPLFKENPVRDDSLDALSYAMQGAGTTILKNRKERKLAEALLEAESNLVTDSAVIADLFNRYLKNREALSKLIDAVRQQ